MTTVAILHTRDQRPAGAETSRPQRLQAALLRVPLLWKVLGADLVLVAGMLIAHFVLPAASTVVELGVLLVLSFLATAGLVWLALRPLQALEETAERVSGGDFSARASGSPLADRQTESLIATVNKLLDRVQADRSRIHYLAGRGVRAREIEREAVARELRDSFAQTLAGVAMQLSATQRINRDADVNALLDHTRSTVQDLTEEMRSVAETLYPGTLTEFGLANAIEALARRVERRSGLHVHVKNAMYAPRLPSHTTSALYRVAEEALRNVEQHGLAQHVSVSLRCKGDIILDIEDDGRGIDMRSRDPLQAGLGLFSAKAMLALCGGELEISSGPRLGTRVTARLPQGAEGHVMNHRDAQ